MEQPNYIQEEMKDYNALHEELAWHRNSIHGWRIQTRAQEKRLQSVQHKLNAKQREFDNLTKSIEERISEVDEKEKKLLEKAKDIEDQVKDLESNKKFYEVRVKLLETRENQYKLLKSKQKEDEQDLQSKEKQFVEQVKAHESKFVEREQELESKFQIQRKQEEQFEEREKVLLSNEKEFDKRLHVLVSMEEEFEETKKMLVSNEKQLEETKEVLDSKEKQLEETMKMLFSMEEDFEETKKVLVATYDTYNLPGNQLSPITNDKSPLVNGLLQLDIQKAKQITEEVVNREKRCEPKVKARDTEIASLRDILKLISDCNLEYLYLVNDIKARILVLEQENQRENSVSIASESPSKEKKHARKTVCNNQVKVQQTAQKKPYDVAVTKNRVEVQQCRKRNRVEVLEVPEHYQSLHQFGNNSKSLRKDVSSSSNSVPHYQQHAVLFGNEERKYFQLSGTHL